RDKILRASHALREGGIRFLEVTLNTDGALEGITAVKHELGGEMLVGAGTVLDLDMAKAAVAAGASYLISPNLDEEVVAYGKSQGVEVWPGVMTPTEMVRAWKAGASAVKVFPIGTLGLNYIKEVSGPLGHIPIMATGGIGLNNVAQVLEAGAIAVGLGSALVDRSLIANENYAELTKRAQSFLQAIGK
ncbi:MAG: ketohydroxyglutarate aldolase, partial [Bacilli bacterium]|nr:ketohydroxyglutarate aldolase [Bacilli bacterium]